SWAFASLAARAVLLWLVTPKRITAASGVAAIVASPVTVTSLSSFSAAGAQRGASAAAAITQAANRTRDIGIVIAFSLRMIFSENRFPPSDQVRRQAFSGSCAISPERTR